MIAKDHVYSVLRASCALAACDKIGAFSNSVLSPL